MSGCHTESYMNPFVGCFCKLKLGYHKFSVCAYIYIYTPYRSYIIGFADYWSDLPSYIKPKAYRTLMKQDPGHDQACQVFIQVSQYSEANGRQNCISHAPGRESAIDASGVDEPATFASTILCNNLLLV